MYICKYGNYCEEVQSVLKTYNRWIQISQVDKSKIIYKGTHILGRKEIISLCSLSVILVSFNDEL
jgi:hypothetical protein